MLRTVANHTSRWCSSSSVQLWKNSHRSFVIGFTVLNKRCFASSSCPFVVLGIPKRSSYASVKKAFVRLALEHHPDTQRKNDKEGHDRDFWEIRQAFESIQEDNDGIGVVVDTTSETRSSCWTDESLSAWFQAQTGQALSFRMDESTRQEVAQVAKTMAPGGLDRGGMWEMANMVARHEKSGFPARKEIPEGQTTTKRRKRR